MSTTSVVANLVFGLALVLQGCLWKSDIKPAAPTGSEVRVAQLGKDSASKIAANAEAADFAASSVPDENVKASIKGPISVIRSLAGPATDKDRAEAMALVVKAQAGKLAEANEGWAKARASADAMNAEVARLNSLIEQERAQAKLDLERKLDEANQKADASRKRIITFIFFGIGAIGIAAGPVMLILAGQNPIFGPKIAFSTMAGGAVLIATGIAINSIEKALEAHPWIIYSGIGLAFVAGIVVLVLMYANHEHEKKPTQ